MHQGLSFRLVAKGNIREERRNRNYETSGHKKIKPKQKSNF